MSLLKAGFTHVQLFQCGSVHRFRCKLLPEPDPRSHRTLFKTAAPCTCEPAPLKAAPIHMWVFFSLHKDFIQYKKIKHTDQDSCRMTANKDSIIVPFKIKHIITAWNEMTKNEL